MGPARAKVDYVLFDMDGLLIDSEAIYTQVTDTILAPYGKKMTWTMKAGCMGKPEREAAAHLLSFFPDISLTIPDYLEQRNALQDALWPTVALLPGVAKLVQHLKAHGVPMAVATSSRRRNFELKTGHLGALFGCFDDKVVCADDATWTMRGKPAPDIFVVAARELLGRDVGAADADAADLTEDQLAERRKGLVFEDALPGMQAGKRAGMSVVWVPDVKLLDVEYSGDEQADQILKSLEDFEPEKWGLPPYA
ncbi:HAD-like domain-containing protein [Mycena belliarum]|uniref:HAD-like domain-containing protein n=1 Tax=Mycena belliarum TaxID=1033014 RepID=A0AAD6XTK4_9AGAR|nr:HAD-like domain-containing protein [Mycena belliae]